MVIVEPVMHLQHQIPDLETLQAHVLVFQAICISLKLSSLSMDVSSWGVRLGGEGIAVYKQHACLKGYVDLSC